ncbi:hypothetical protein D3C81_1045540 [compost metagenome]
MPGRRISWPDTEIASDATTKNQPPDIDIIMFHSSPGIANGTSSRQKRCHGESRNMAAASSRSPGMVRNDWYRLNAMFHACEVKMAKIAAHSTPAILPGNSAIKPVTVIDRKPSTGIDCRMSSAGTSTFSAVRLLDASAANASENSSDAASAASMRMLVRIR